MAAFRISRKRPSSGSDQPTTPADRVGDRLNSTIAMRSRTLLQGLILVSVSAMVFLPFYVSFMDSSNDKETSVATSRTDCSRKRRVHVGIFTGRWMFLRVLLPYLYRELRHNGGVVDRVLFAMMQYNDETQTKLKDFATSANSVLNDEVFQFLYLNKDPHAKKEAVYPGFYYHVFKHLMQYPSDVYFKLDDDIVYIHPHAFSTMRNNKDSGRCFMHFGNIVSNWRCNWLHQQIGVYDDDEVNPKGLTFDYAPNAECGWKRADCAEMTLRTFVHHYQRKQLNRYMFNGLDKISDRVQFSIQFFLLDSDLVDFEKMLTVGPIGKEGTESDEKWWTAYSQKVENPGCIVGEGFVVHFSYYPTVKHLLDSGLLEEFENIVRKEVGTKMPQLLWDVTDL